MEEAIDFQILVGPSGEIIREANELGQAEAATDTRGYEKLYDALIRGTDGVYMPSSTWLIMASK